MIAAAAVRSATVSGNSAVGSARWRGAAFGLAVHASGPIDGVGRVGNGTPSAGAVELEIGDSAALEDAVSGFGKTCLLDRRFDSGRTMLRIDRYEERGYRVATPRYGRHLVSLDGRHIRSVRPDVFDLKWQRLLFAQVLPLAATLQGIEVLHASGVVIGDHAYGFVAPSGTGKTSVAVNLAARGADLLTDDVLAIDFSTDDLVAYAGGRLVNVAKNEFRALDREARARLGTVLGRTDKVHVRPHEGRGAAPLAGLYFLRRESRSEGKVKVRGRTALDPRQLLAARFITYLSEPLHLLRHFEAAARMAAELPAYAVDVPRNRTASDVADAVLEHAARERSV